MLSSLLFFLLLLHPVLELPGLLLAPEGCDRVAGLVHWVGEELAHLVGHTIFRRGLVLGGVVLVNYVGIIFPQLGDVF